MQIAQAIGSANTPKDAIGPIHQTDREHAATPFEGVLRAGEEAEKQAAANALLPDLPEEADVLPGSVGAAPAEKATSKSRSLTAENEKLPVAGKQPAPSDAETPSYTLMANAPATAPSARPAGANSTTPDPSNPVDANKVSARPPMTTDAHGTKPSSSTAEENRSVHSLHTNNQAQNDAPMNVVTPSHASDTKLETVLVPTKQNADRAKASTQRGELHARGHAPIRPDYEKPITGQLPVSSQTTDSAAQTVSKATPISAMVEGLSIANGTKGRADATGAAGNPALTPDKPRKAPMVQGSSDRAIRADTALQPTHHADKAPGPQLTNLAAKTEQKQLPVMPPQTVSQDPARPVELTHPPSMGASGNITTDKKRATDLPQATVSEGRPESGRGEPITAQQHFTAQKASRKTAYDTRTTAEMRTIDAPTTPIKTTSTPTQTVSPPTAAEDNNLNPRTDKSIRIESHTSGHTAPPQEPRLSPQPDVKTAPFNGPTQQPAVALEQAASTAHAAMPLDPASETEIPVWDVRPHAAQSNATTLSPHLHRAEMPPHTSHAIAEAFRKAPDKPIELTLNPTELGRVRMVMTTQDAGIIVTITTERGDTLDLMRRNIDDLGRSLSDLGFEDVSFAFEQGQNASSDQEEGARDSGLADMADLQDEAETASTPTAHAPPTHIATTGIDMRL